MNLIILSNVFYKKYGNCREVLQKKDRPYLCLTVMIDNVSYAIPLRHHIKHRYAFFTIDDAGLDYSKAVVIESADYISSDNPRSKNILQYSALKYFFE